MASIDMTDTSSTCPPGLQMQTLANPPRRLCAKNIDVPQLFSQYRECSTLECVARSLDTSREVPMLLVHTFIMGKEQLIHAMLMGSASLMEQVLANTFGHLLQHFMIITLHTMYVPALTPATLHLLQYLTI